MVRIKAYKVLINDAKPKWRLFSVGILFGIIAVISQLIVPKKVMVLLDNFSKGIKSDDLISVIIWVLVEILAAMISGYILAKFGQLAIQKLRISLWDRYLKYSMAFNSTWKTGEKISRLTSDITTVNVFLSVTLPELIKSIILILGTVIILFTLNWQFSLVLLTSLPMFLLLVVPVVSILEKLTVKNQKNMATFIGDATEVLDNIQLVKINSTEVFEVNQGTKNINQLYSTALKGTAYESVIVPLVTMLVILDIFGILSFGVYQIANKQITLGILVSSLMYIIQLVAPIAEMGQLVGETSKALGSSNELVKLFNHKTEDLISGFSVIKSGNLNFKNVTFSYHDAEKNVLKDVSFEAKRGEVTAIVGPSGSGKSTILSLIERLYDIDSGSIEYGDTNIKDYQLSSWRNYIGYVTQRPFLRTGTVNDNLIYGLSKPVNEKNISLSIEHAGFLSDVNNMPLGLKASVGIRGANISGGQQQRLSIARILLKNADIVLYDEATSALDSKTEKIIKNTMYSQAPDKVTIVVAHRLSTIVDAHKIIFLESGQVTGFGIHDELMNTHPLYREYVENQII